VVVRVAGVPAEHTEFAGVRILADIGERHGRDAVVAQHRGAGVDDLVRRILAASGGAEHVAGLDRIALGAQTIRSLALEDDEHLVFDMVVVERAARLAGLDFGIADAQILDPDHRPDARVGSAVEVALAPAVEREIGNVHDRLAHCCRSLR